MYSFTCISDVSSIDQGDFDVYDIPDALDPEVPMDPSVFLNGTFQLPLAFLPMLILCRRQHHSQVLART